MLNLYSWPLAAIGTSTGVRAISGDAIKTHQRHSDCCCYCFYDACGRIFVYVCRLFLSTSSDLMKHMSSLELSVHAMDMEGEVLIWLSTMLEDYKANSLTVTLRARGGMGVEIALLTNYILMRGSRPRVDFLRPPYSPAGTHKRHGRRWPLGTPTKHLQGGLLQYMKTSDVTFSRVAIRWSNNHWWK